MTVVAADPYGFVTAPVVADDPSERVRRLSGGRMAVLAAGSELAACLPVLLVALGWRGEPRQLLEALPHGERAFDLTDFLNVMVRLGYLGRVRRGSWHLARDAAVPPLLLMPRSGGVRVVTDVQTKNIVLWDGRRTETVTRAALGRWGTRVVFDEAEPAAIPSGSWFAQALRPLRGALVSALLLTVAANLLAVGVPMYVMMVYDRVIVSGSLSTLAYLASGAMAAVFLDYLIRRVRQRTLSYAATRLATTVGDAVLGRLLDLSSGMTERAGVSTQVARIRDVERVRDLCAGSFAQAVLDLPFALVFLGAMWTIAGTLALVPTVATGVVVGAGWILRSMVTKRSGEAGRTAARRQELVLETVEKMRALRINGAEARWRDRFIDLSAQAARGNFHSREALNAIQTASQLTISLTGLLTVAVGVNLVVAGSLSVGTLIAVMMLVWRTLGALQGAFLAMTRVGQLRASIRQIDVLMSMTPEVDPCVHRTGTSTLSGAGRRPAGEVVFDRVTFRYPGEAEPALSGVTFTVEPGELVGIVGRNGSGKSSLLKLLAGLHLPQYGGIRLDGRDIRQYDKVRLRQAIAIVPQSPRFFPDTLRANMLLAVPTATEADIWQALERTGIEDAVRGLPQGLDTAVDPSRPQAIGASLMSRLSIARALLKDAPIRIFDEPVNGLDFEADFQLVTVLQNLRGHSTVFMATYRPSHIRLCDKAIVLEHGSLRFFGPASQVADELPEEYM